MLLFDGWIVFVWCCRVLLSLWALRYLLFCFGVLLVILVVVTLVVALCCVVLFD